MQTLLQMQGITLSHNCQQELQRAIKIKGDNVMVYYKEALSKIQPNFEAEDPLNAPWITRKIGGPVGTDAVSRLSAVSSKMTFVSASPSKLSMRQINSPLQKQQHSPRVRVQLDIVPPIRKLVPGEEAQISPRQVTVATADSTVIN